MDDCQAVLLIVGFTGTDEVGKTLAAQPFVSDKGAEIFEKDGKFGQG
jgi:hypothetical protein